MMENKRPYEPVHNLSIGQIYEVDGNQIRIDLDSTLEELTRVYAGEVYSIGQFGSIIQIPIGKRVVFAMVTKLTMKNEIAEASEKLPPKDDSRVIIADLFGEGVWKKTDSGKWMLNFERGVSEYPLPLQTAYLTEKSILARIYKKGRGERIKLGNYVGSGGVECHADISALIGKHTAILGSTGSGKSAATSAVVHSILELKGNSGNWSPQVIILDPHGEYKKAFPNATVLSSDDNNLHLPYWLLNFQETVELLIGKTEFVATSQANIIKEALLKLRQQSNEKSTLDSPVPYKVSQIVEEIKPDESWSSSKKEKHNKILSKIEILQSDARLKFLMNDWAEGTTLESIVAPILQITNAPVIVDLSGMPDEVVAICSSAIARTLFNSKVWQTSEERKKNPILLVCEEAHRYVPNRGEAQYGATQQAIQRIAKEGRKYGIGLFLISQRPSEIDQTVLSQCNSWIVLRLTNEEDKSKVASILPDSLSGLTKMLSGLRNQEAIFAGLASDIPARIRIRDLEKKQLPNSNDIDFFEGWSKKSLSNANLKKIVKRWQRQSFGT